MLLKILIPVFNDWESLRLLLPQLDRAMTGLGHHVSVLVVDDASTEPMPPDWPGQNSIQGLTALDSLEILHLRSNQGHQRAIALGLYHLHEFTDMGAVIVMDGDGEDRAEDLPELLRVLVAGNGEVVFAARTKRMESLAFRLFYKAYRLVHLSLTGVVVQVGNFCVVPRPALARLMAVPDLWNHFAASVYRARLPRTLVPLPRGRRLAGESKMNFVSLLIHGLSAMSVFSDQVSARLLTAAASFAALAIGLMGVTAGLRWFTNLTIPGWPAFSVGVLLLLVVQLLSFAMLFAFLIAGRRNSLNFLLTRDAPHFILGKTVVYGGADAEDLRRMSLAVADSARPGLARREA